MLQAGSIGLLGLGMNHVAALRDLADETSSPKPTSHKAVIYIFFREVSHSTTASIRSLRRRTIFGESLHPLPRGRRGCRFASTCQCWRPAATVGASAVSDASVQRTFDRAPCDVDRPNRAADWLRWQPTDPQDFPSIASVVTGVVPPTEQSCLRPPFCRKADSRHRSHHSRTIRRGDGVAGRPVVYRGQPVIATRITFMERSRVWLSAMGGSRAILRISLFKPLGWNCHKESCKIASTAASIY